MRTHYSTLFLVELNHAFYANNMDRDLELVPWASTQAFMHQYNLLWRTSDNQYKMLFGEEEQRGAALSELSDTIVLRFFIKTNNPYFYNFTELPFHHRLEEKLYFHNWGTIHADNPVQLKKEDPANLGFTSTVFVRRANKGEGDPDQEAYLAVAEEADRVQQALNPTHIGLLEIYISKKTPNSLQIPQKGIPFQAPVFQIHFQARTTHWRYFLINNSEIQFDRMELTDEAKKETLPFETSPVTQLNNGQKAIPILVKDSEIPDWEQRSSRERPPLKPRLKLSYRDDTNVPKDIFMNLPVPDYKQIKPEKTGNDLKIFSDMYVYFFKPNFF
jgi:hypothetical protein